MAKILVTNDTETIRVEIASPDGYETDAYTAFCSGCGDDIVMDTHERFSMEDTIEAAGLHVDHKH